MAKCKGCRYHVRTDRTPRSPRCAHHGTYSVELWAHDCGCSITGIHGENEHCICDAGYTGATCSACAPGRSGYPNCKPCTAVNCSSRGTASVVNNACTCRCDTGFAGATCSHCAAGFAGCPYCAPCNSTVGCSSHGTASIVNDTCTCSCDAGYGGPSCGMCATGFAGYPHCSLCATYDPFHGNPMSNPVAPPNTTVSAVIMDSVVTFTVTWDQRPQPFAMPGLVLSQEPPETGALSAISALPPDAFWGHDVYVPNECHLGTTASMPLSACAQSSSDTVLTFACSVHHGAVTRLPGPLQGHYIASWSEKVFRLQFPVVAEGRSDHVVQVATLYCGTTADSVSCLIYVGEGVSLGVPSVTSPSWVKDCTVRAAGGNLSYVDCAAAPPQLPLTANLSIFVNLSSSNTNASGTSVAGVEQPINMPLPRVTENVSDVGLSVERSGHPTGGVVYRGNGDSYELVLASKVGTPEVLTVSLQGAGGFSHVVARECWSATADAARGRVTVRWAIGCSVARNNSLVGVQWTVVVTTRLFSSGGDAVAGGAVRKRDAQGLTQHTVSVDVGSVVVDDAASDDTVVPPQPSGGAPQPAGDGGGGGPPAYAWCILGGGGSAIAVLCLAAVIWKCCARPDVTATKPSAFSQLDLERNDKPRSCEVGANPLSPDVLEEAPL